MTSTILEGTRMIFPESEQVAAVLAEMSRSEICAEAILWTQGRDAHDLGAVSEADWSAAKARASAWFAFVSDREARLWTMTDGKKGKPANPYTVRSAYWVSDDGETRIRGIHDAEHGAFIVVEDLVTVPEFEVNGVTRNQQWPVRNVAKVGTTEEDLLDWFRGHRQDEKANRESEQFSKRADFAQLLTDIADGVEPVTDPDPELEDMPVVLDD